MHDHSDASYEALKFAIESVGVPASPTVVLAAAELYRAFLLTDPMGVSEVSAGGTVVNTVNP